MADVDAEEREEVGVLVRQAGADPLLHLGDPTREASNEEMTRAAVERFGRVDVLYNAAGLVRFGAAHELSLEDWQFTMDHELTITFLGCKHALRSMLETGSGSIINISSVSGLFGSSANHAAHAATKAAIVGLTRQIATQYGPMGIRCNAIAPGYLMYGPGERRVQQQSHLRSVEGIPFQRFTTPQDTASCALFLASDESSDITGQTFVLDGGRSAM